MSRDGDLREIERRSWRLQFEDGLFDIFLGLQLLIAPIGALLDNAGVQSPQRVAITIGLEAAAILSFVSAKRFIARPRTGQVRYGPRRRARLSKARLAVAVAVVVTALLWLVVSLNADGRLASVLPSLIMVLVILGTLGSLGYFLDYDRLYLYGVLFALPELLKLLFREFAGIDPGWLVFAVPAMIIVLIGSVTLFRFLRDHPVPPEDGADGR